MVSVCMPNCLSSKAYSLPTESNFFPEQLLVNTDNGTEILGDMPEINQPLSFSESGPIAVDAISRNVFWYSRIDNVIYCQSLHSGSRKVGIVQQILLSLGFMSLPGNRIEL